MIAFIGDVHRAFDRLAGAVAGLPTSVEIAIQVGDLGLHLTIWARPRQDFRPWHAKSTTSPEITITSRPTAGLSNRPRWHQISCLFPGDGAGAGRTADRLPRRRKFNHRPGRTAERGGLVAGRTGHLGRCRAVRRRWHSGYIGLHTPPAFVYHFFQLPPDPSALAVGQAWQILGRPQVVCGHLHKPREVGCVRVLGELEVLLA